MHLQISRLESIKALRGLLRLPLMRSLLGAILPGLVLRLLVLTMPIWLRMLVWRAGPISLSEVRRYVSMWHETNDSQLFIQWYKAVSFGW